MILTINIPASAIDRTVPLSARTAAQEAIAAQLLPGSEVWIQETLTSIFPPMTIAPDVSPMPRTPAPLLRWLADEEMQASLPDDQQDEPNGVCFTLEVPDRYVKRGAWCWRVAA